MGHTHRGKHDLAKLSLLPQNPGEEGRSQHRTTLALPAIIAGDDWGNFLSYTRLLASKGTGEEIWGQLSSVSCSKWKWEQKMGNQGNGNSEEKTVERSWQL